MENCKSNLNLPEARPVTIPTGDLPAGFPLVDVPPGHHFWLQVTGYHTFDEGLEFYHRLEAFNQYVQAVRLSPSGIDRMLVCISRTQTQIYANNQLPMIAKVRVKRSVKAGEPIYLDHIAAVDRIDFPGVHPLSGCGFLLLISAGWRKGMCFDLSPLPAEGQEARQSLRHHKKDRWNGSSPSLLH